MGNKGGSEAKNLHSMFLYFSIDSHTKAIHIRQDLTFAESKNGQKEEEE